MYEINEKERCVVPVDVWTTKDVKYIETCLDVDVAFSDDDRWGILKRAADHANRMDMALTSEILEDIIEEKGE